MYPTMKSLGIDKLSVAERILLVEEIWDSIAEENNAAPLQDWQKQELERRLQNAKANPQGGSSWAEVKERLRAKL
jgi:putative addiction module component (TIGR02574 family)